MSSYNDFSDVLSLAGTAIATSYTDSTTNIQPFRSGQVMVAVKAVLNAASTITTTTVKVELSPNGTDWYPFQTRYHGTDGAVATKKEHAIATAANATHLLLFTGDPRGGNFLRVSAKADAAGHANDTLNARVTISG